MTGHVVTAVIYDPHDGTTAEVKADLRVRLEGYEVAILSVTPCAEVLHVDGVVKETIDVRDPVQAFDAPPSI